MTGVLGMAAALASACAAILAVGVAVIGMRWALNRWRYRKIPGA